MSSESFWTSDKTSENDVLTSILMNFHQKNSVTARPCWPSPFTWFYCYYRLPEGEKSRRAVVRSPVLHHPQHSIQFLILGCAKCGEWRVLSRAHPLALSKRTLVPHHSGQIPKTVALYNTPSKYWGRYVRSGVWKVKSWADPSTWQSSWTPV
jgi:hypothetical protein